MGYGESSRKFEFIREIASGGFGRVYLAKVIHRDGFARLVAIKILHKKWTQNDEIASRMRDEARLLGWLRHKNIVDVMDLTSIDGRCAVIMEYLEAVDLSTIIQASIHSERRLPLRVILESIAAVASALDAAYNRPPYAAEKPLRVIHRDIKPSNVMIDDQGMVKVLDFGVARAEFDHRESKTKDLAFGSMEYMSPERLFFEPETPASDVYSLGVTLYELMALKKFGKAKLRAAAHAEHVEARLNELEDVYPMPNSEMRGEMRVMLRGMLAFSQADRWSASDVMTRMRSFARGLRQVGLEEWAATVVPPLVKQVQRRQAQRESNSPLLGAVIQEDEGTAAFRRSGVSANPNLSTDSSELRAPISHQTGGSTTVPTTLKRSSNNLRMQKSNQLTPPHGSDASAHSNSSDGLNDAPTEPKPRLSSTPPMPPPRSARLLIVIIGLATGFITLLVGIFMIVGVFVTWRLVSDMGEQQVKLRPAPTAEVVPKMPIGPNAQFISLLPDTKKMSVRCDGGKGDGSMEATVVGAALGTCTVTALYEGRKRKTAMIEKTESARYKCFRDGAQSCELAVP